MSRATLDAAYYQALHDTHPAFQNNNWLTQDLEVLKSWPGQSIAELGCGNGRFLEQAADRWARVVGVDWARSPVLDEVIGRKANVSFVQADILSWTPEESFDVVASADFLEHLPTAELPGALQRFHSFGRRHYHRIACYDDGHSHLSIYPPEWWMETFDRVAPGAYRLLSREARKGDQSKLVITVGCI